jgi:hypothetical protein
MRATTKTIPCEGRNCGGCNGDDGCNYSNDDEHRQSTGCDSNSDNEYRLQQRRRVLPQGGDGCNGGSSIWCV